MAKWYIFTSGPGADPLDPTNYSSPQSNKPSCPGCCKICAIWANDNTFGHPIITQDIQDDIVRALQYGSDQTRVTLRA